MLVNDYMPKKFLFAVIENPRDGYCPLVCARIFRDENTKRSHIESAHIAKQGRRLDVIEINEMEDEIELFEDDEKIEDSLNSRKEFLETGPNIFTSEASSYLLEVDNAKFPNLIKKSAELFRKNKRCISLPELKLMM